MPYDANGNDISHPKPVGQLSEYPDGWKFATIPLDVAEQLMAEHPILANVIVIHDVDPNGEYIADLIKAVGHIGGERPEEADPATLQRLDDQARELVVELLADGPMDYGELRGIGLGTGTLLNTTLDSLTEDGTLKPRESIFAPYELAEQTSAPAQGATP